MKVLIVGGGGREHALAWKLSQSPRLTGLFASPGSAAIAEVATCVALEGIGGLEAMADFVEKEGIGLTVVGPEAPLVEGIADLFTSRGLLVFGPTAAAARLEGSKVFSKAFMERHGIPTAAHGAFDALAPALDYVKALDGPCVVKASGLAAGKGVILCHDASQGEAALRRIMEARAFGDAGAEVVVEEWLRGEEASYFAICDGKDFIATPSAQDHKPVGDLDRGLNTGGMGAYCPTPLVTPEMEAMVIEQVV
ncbi:MAG: phosphoribosylamine--glycine ligase, partial [SAR324 cluster bacterium]|nr:phosphoribosylamine--glycine ligase [SAR324 cluster bacterium]